MVYRAHETKRISSAIGTDADDRRQHVRAGTDDGDNRCKPEGGRSDGAALATQVRGAGSRWPAVEQARRSPAAVDAAAEGAVGRAAAAEDAAGVRVRGALLVDAA